MSARSVPRNLQEALLLLDEPESVAVQRVWWLRFADEVWAPPRERAGVARMLERFRLVQSTLAAWPEARLGDRERELIDFLVQEAVRAWKSEG